MSGDLPPHIECHGKTYWGKARNGKPIHIDEHWSVEDLRAIIGHREKIELVDAGIDVKAKP